MLLLCMSELLCAAAKLRWHGGRIDWRNMRTGSKGAGQLVFYSIGEHLALSVRYGRRAQHISARLSLPLSRIMTSAQDFKVLNSQGKEIGAGRSVFAPDFDWGVGQDYWYPDGGYDCELSFTDALHGQVELKLGASVDKGLQFVEGRVSKDAHGFAWWHNPDLLPLSAIDTSFYEGGNDQVQLTYTSNERNNIFYLDSSFALLLKASYRHYYLEALADAAQLPGAIWGRDDSVRLIDPITESSIEKIGQGRCQRAEDGVVCNFEIDNGKLKATLTKTYRDGELTSIAGTLTKGRKTISWEEIDMRAVAPPPLP